MSALDCRAAGVLLLRLVLLALPLKVAVAHPGDPHHEADAEPPYSGAAYLASDGGAPAIAFPSSGVALRSWLPIPDLDPNATAGNSCWGYVSASGREYALIGINTGTAVVEVTDPDAARLVAHLPGPTSIWRDIKTYQHFAYAVSEGGGGIQVFDLAAIDLGTITTLAAVTDGGTLSSHTVAINEQSGRLYRAGGQGVLQGLRVYSLAAANAPAFLGAWNNRYCHETQVVTWTKAPFAGVEVAFCYADDYSGGGNPGIEILNVSDPGNISVIGSINLSQPPILSHPAVYSHQGWLSPDRRYVYFDDEMDEHYAPYPLTTTRIIDVGDLTAPAQAGLFTNTTTARDHNQYTLGSRIFQANYRSGLRVLDATDPLVLSEIAYFDTYPEDDVASYNGLWNVYPYFPSGTVIGSDIEKGLFVWSLDLAPPAPVPALPGVGLGLLAALVLAASLIASRGVYRP